jgi:poly(glycerol-phosphate) alpha-glucosyltransferase
LLDQAAKQAAFVEADVFALPAIGEGLSMSMLEAMSAEIPVLITPGCNLPAVEDRGAGLLVDPEVAAIADGLLRLLRNPDDLRRSGAQARTWIASEFTWKVVAEQLSDVYASEIARFGHRAKR